MFVTSVRQVELLGIKTVYTDHSLFSPDSLGCISLDILFRHYSCFLGAMICVSHADCENVCRRLRLYQFPSNMYIIPNAVEASRFQRDYSTHPLVSRIRSQFSPGSILIVVLSRLVYRKGIFLLEDVLDRVLTEYPNVNALIGGDGDQAYVIQALATRWNQRCKRLRILVMGSIAVEDNAPFLVSIHLKFLHHSPVEISTFLVHLQSPLTLLYLKRLCWFCFFLENIVLVVE